MNEKIEQLREDLGLTRALANHLYSMLTDGYIQLPRMEAYRLRRALKEFNTLILCTYGVGYHMLPEDRDYYCNEFKIPKMRRR